MTARYDSNGRVAQQAQADGGTYSFSYQLDANRNVTAPQITDPDGSVREMTFNSNGYCTGDARAVGRAEEQTVTYNRDLTTNLLQSMTDARGARPRIATIHWATSPA